MGTSLVALLEAQNKQQLEINHLKESNSTLVWDLMDQTLRITQLEETIEALMNTTESLTSQNQTLQTTIDNLETLKTQVATQNEQIEALNNESPNNSTEIIQQQVETHINTLHTQQFWQRELDRSANQL